MKPVSLRAGLLFRGQYLALSKLLTYIPDERFHVLGPVRLAVWLALHEQALKHENGNVVWTGLKTLRSLAGGNRNKQPNLDARSVRDALFHLGQAHFLASLNWGHAVDAKGARWYGLRRKLYGTATISGKILTLGATPQMACALDDLQDRRRGWGRGRWVKIRQAETPETVIKIGQAPSIKIGQASHQDAAGPPIKMRQAPHQDAAGLPIKIGQAPSFESAPLEPRETKEEEASRSGRPLIKIGQVSNKGTAEAGEALGTAEADATEATTTEDLLLTKKNLFSDKQPSENLPSFFQEETPAPAPSSAGENDVPPEASQGLHALLAKIKAKTRGRKRYPVPMLGRELPARPDGTHYSIPPPPRIPRGASRLEQLQFCAKWYTAAVQSRLPKAHPLRLGGVTKQFLEDALDVWQEHNIPPGAWVAWALDRILEKLPTNARNRFQPRVSALLSPKTLTESRWQYEEVRLTYDFVQREQSPAGAALNKRLTHMQLECSQTAREWTPQALVELQARYFPEGWAEAVSVAEENSRMLGQEVKTKVKLGLWIWRVPKLGGAANGEGSNSGEEGRRSAGAAVQPGA